MFGIVPFRNNKVQERGSMFDIDSIFSEFFNGAPFGLAAAGGIKADIRENEREFIIEAEIPGASKDEITLDLRDDRLTISVEKKEEVREERDNYIRRERRYGSCSRSFYVENIKQDEVKAKYDNGILSVVLPKSEVKKVRNRIEIQ